MAIFPPDLRKDLSFSDVKIATSTTITGFYARLVRLGRQLPISSAVTDIYTATEELGRLAEFRHCF